MGIQDRDYYREKHKKASNGNSRDSFAHYAVNQTSYRPRGKFRSRDIRYLLYPVITIVALWYSADVFLNYQKAGKFITPPPISAIPEKQNVLDSISGGIILKSDQQGHFRGTVLVNNVPMPFLIDTGATTTVIPVKMALVAGLPFGRSIQTSTAGGKVTDRQTQINSLKIGNAEIRNLDAHINGYLDEVLIGMNTLKHFHMTQSGNTMTLVANSASVRQVASAPPGRPGTLATEQPVIKRPTTIKKTVSCDARQVCTTKFSDH